MDEIPVWVGYWNSKIQYLTHTGLASSLDATYKAGRLFTWFKKKINNHQIDQ
jgi:hypothetical protein